MRLKIRWQETVEKTAIVEADLGRTIEEVLAEVTDDECLSREYGQDITVLDSQKAEEA